MLARDGARRGSRPYPAWVSPLERERAARCLAVYGSLRRGGRHHDELAGLAGTWRAGCVRGRLGERDGYPTLQPDADAPPCEVELFESDELPRHWARLDAFEGDGYRRVLVTVELAGEPQGVVTQLYAPR